ncbi:hypothetical protein PILCRDRAFT_16193 [Piloderma croceum F 1598]|uniref:Uncharacterized protein n=1 Tax=Piloderma croceum (strain F 1598) TaxID=765440 RepID=A0A0C3EI94_PILCF|nr:hypothetical protein PILCRDRAFT_16193 [Piloderma croceum F 1598]
MLPPNSTRTAHNTDVGSPTGSTPQIEGQALANYRAEPDLCEFMNKYQTASFKASCFEIRKDVGLGSKTTFTDVQHFRGYFSSPPDVLTQIQIIEVHELSAHGLQAIGSFFGIHLDFWAWITSDEAADGYWLHNHNDGKVLCFDLPGIEFYRGPNLPSKAFMRSGRLKQLSSLHRFYGDELASDGLFNLFANRRVSVYLLKHNDLPVFIHFREDCQHISSLQLKRDPADRIAGIFGKTFYEKLQAALATDKDTYKGLGEDPICLVAMIQSELMLSWHHLAQRLQNDLEKLDNRLNYSALEAVPLYLDRDITHMLERFAQHMEAHQGFVRYCISGQNSLRPGIDATILLNRVDFNTQILQRRLQRLAKRIGGISNTMHNQLANQRARLQRLDTQISLEQGRSVARLSLIATFFVPLSFSASVLSMNADRPLWIYFAVAMPCTVLTAITLIILNWASKPVQLLSPTILMEELTEKQHQQNAGRIGSTM